MSLSPLLYFANQNYLVYIRTLYWLCTLVFEIYFSIPWTWDNFDSSIHWKTSLYHQGTTIWGICRKSGKRPEAHEVESSFLSKRWKKSRKQQSFRPFVQQNTSHHFLIKTFRGDVLKLLENIKFRDTKNHFQENLANDLKKINSSDKIFVFADKTRNIYETSTAWKGTYSVVFCQEYYRNKPHFPNVFGWKIWVGILSDFMLYFQCEYVSWYG